METLLQDRPTRPLPRRCLFKRLNAWLRKERTGDLQLRQKFRRRSWGIPGIVDKLRPQRQQQEEKGSHKNYPSSSEDNPSVRAETIIYEETVEITQSITRRALVVVRKGDGGWEVVETYPCPKQLSEQEAMLWDFAPGR